MAMSIGGSGPRKAELNVTPLIDVLLVLLIIFMVILPTHSNGLDARIPQPPDSTASSEPPPPTNDVVITVQANRMVKLNQEPVAVDDLAARLRVVSVSGVGRVIFLRAEKELEFQDVAAVIDIARGVGLNRIALMTQ